MGGIFCFLLADFRIGGSYGSPLEKKTRPHPQLDAMPQRTADASRSLTLGHAVN